MLNKRCTHTERCVSESFLIFFIVKDCLKCGKEYGIIIERVFD